MIEVALAAVASMAVCVGSCIIVVRARERYLVLQAGSLSRRWIATHAVEVISDQEAVEAARASAEFHLRLAFDPPSVEELMATPGEAVETGQRAKELGRHYNLIRSMSTHLTILILLQDRSLSAQLRKLIEGTYGLERVIGAMAQPAAHAVGKRDDDSLAEDIEANFTRVDHGGVAWRLAAYTQRRRGLAMA